MLLPKLTPIMGSGAVLEDYEVLVGSVANRKIVIVL